MSKILYYIAIFTLGLFVGWLNPIEGPLDWTYDEYSSQPAHKSPVKAIPIQKEDKVNSIESIDLDLDNEALFIRLIKKLETYDNYILE